MNQPRLAVVGRRMALVLLAALMLAGCSVLPYRPYMGARHDSRDCLSPAQADPDRVTPERHPGYTLHFVEFDDQGWAFPDGEPAGDGDAVPSRQIDCVMADLRQRLEVEQRQVVSFVYVHGWKHSAAKDDTDVAKFRALLASRAEKFPGREVVGIYVGWQGNTVDLWGLRNLTFWSRKNAAHHVAEGRVRELFSRIRGLRAYWNGPQGGASDGGIHGCNWEVGEHDRCRLRTVLIGHSFGGLVLYNSAAPYLLEMLSVDRDLPEGSRRERAREQRARGIADLIVLLNPAFEGSRYEPVFEASRHYRAADDEPPILVMLTSTADWATKNAFPIARWFNSVFQYPSSSDAQSEAMRRTPGHTARYLTHKLCLGDTECADRPGPGGEGLVADSPELHWGDGRRFCGGLLLRAYASPDRPFRPIVWNVRTHAEVIPDHNEITRPIVLRFVEQVYGDVTGLPGDVCGEDYEPIVQAAEPGTP